MPQWAITTEPAELTIKEGASAVPVVPSPPKRRRLSVQPQSQQQPPVQPPPVYKPAPKCKKPLVKEPVSLQRLAALSIVSHADFNQLVG